MTDDAIIKSNDMIQDSTYDRLAAWGRRWLPLLSVIFIAIAGVFGELTKVHGLEHIAPWFVAIGGIFAAVSAGINEFLKRAKELWTYENNRETFSPGEEYLMMSQEERLDYVKKHPELFEHKESNE